MARDARMGIVRDVDTLFQVGTATGATDEQLLERFTTGRELSAESAFSTLVERHGPMVLRVCRGVLRDTHDAQDAFQATFLILARKARTIRKRDALGSWLHGVALRVASCARAASARRRRHEQHAAERPVAVEEGPRDWEPLLQEEIGRLPERYRAAVVLCDLQGLTHEQAAGQLGCPIGTIKSRQARGRDRLRSRLTRRGLAPTAVGMLPTTLVLPPTLIDSTARAAARYAASKLVAAGTVSAAVATLIEGTLMTMLGTKLKIAALLVLSMGVVGGGAGVLLGQDRADSAKVENAAAARPKAPAIAENEQLLLEPDLATLRKRILEAARQRLETQRPFYEQGRITIDRYLETSRQLMKAEILTSVSEKEKVAAAKAHYDRVKEVLQREKAEFVAGRSTASDVAEALQEREQAEFDYVTLGGLGELEVDAPRQLSDRSSARPAKFERELAALRTKILEAAREREKLQLMLYRGGESPVDRYLDASRQLMQAEIQASGTRAGKIAAADAQLARLNRIVKQGKDAVTVGRGTTADIAEIIQEQNQASLDLLTMKLDEQAPNAENLERRLRDMDAKLQRVVTELEDLKGQRGVLSR
jgi:RNA polymerase sigma factor (sigma-70 family)